MDALKIALYGNGVVLAGAATKLIVAYMQRLTRRLEGRHGLGPDLFEPLGLESPPEGD